MITILWVNAAVGLGTALLGAKVNSNMRKKEQERGMGMQMEANRQMSELSKEQQLEIWEKTGYGAQKKQLKEAGLNPALLYGSSGGGGATTGGGAIGSTAVPSAGQYDIGGQIAQIALMKAQEKVLESQAKKNEAEAENIQGIQTEEAQARIADLTQGIENKKAQQHLTRAQTVMQEVQNEIAEAGKEVEIQKVFWSGQQALNALQQAENETYISNETYKEKVEQIKLDTIRMAIENEAKRAGIKLTEAQTESVLKGIQFKDEELDIASFEAALKAATPSLQNVLGGELQERINWLNKVTRKETNYRIYERKENRK